MEALPPGPSQPALLQLARLATNPLAMFDTCAARYGDVFTLRMLGTPPVVMFSHPDAIRDIFTASPDDLYAGEGNRLLESFVGPDSLLLLDGPRHKRERKLLMPPFHGERMQTYGDTMAAITDAAVARWPRGETFPVLQEMQAITLEVILQTVFGLDEASRLARLRDRLTVLIERSANPLMLGLAIAVSPARIVQVLGFGVDPARNPTPWQKNVAAVLPWHTLAAAARDVDEILRAEIARRRASGTHGRTDVLSMLVDARDEAGEPMTEDELRDEMMTLLAAGHETTATTLAWVFRWLVARPDVQDRARAEVAAVASDGVLAPAAVASLTWLDAVIRETLRINPILPNVVRRTQRPVTLGGVALPAGVVAAAGIALAHKRKDVWGDPEVFRPERFAERRVSPYEYLPFGGGVRRCLGMAFAMYEMKVVLARVLQRVRVLPGSQRPVRPVRRGIAIAPSQGMPIQVA